MGSIANNTQMPNADRSLLYKARVIVADFVLPSVVKAVDDAETQTPLMTDCATSEQ
jgi:hypothetical protein